VTKQTLQIWHADLRR